LDILALFRKKWIEESLTCAWQAEKSTERLVQRNGYRDWRPVPVTDRPARTHSGNHGHRAQRAATV
jgi:hypothetical protein